MDPLEFFNRESQSTRRKSKARSRAGAAINPLDIFDKLPIGLFILDDEGRLAYANPALAYVLGYACAADLPDEPSPLLAGEFDRKLWSEMVAKDGVLNGLQLRMRRADGSELLAEVNVQVVYGADGQPVYYEGTLTDVTERVETELALQELTEALTQSQSRYLGLFENSPVALWEEDFSAVKGYVDDLRRRGVSDFRAFFHNNSEAVADCMALVKVEDVNRTTLTVYRAGSKEELLAGLPRILSSETLRIFYEELQTIAAGGTVFESEGQNRRLDGEVFDIFLRWSVAPGYEDSYAKVFVMTVDISERKRAERRERQRAERTAALAEIAQATLAVGLETESIYTVIVERVAELLGDAAVLGVISDDKSSIRVTACKHTDPQANQRVMDSLPPQPMQLTESIISRTLRAGESIFLPETTNHELIALAPPALVELTRLFNLHSLMITPLGSPGTVIGVLAALRERPDAPFTLDDLVFLQSLAAQTALTILNAQLHDLVVRQAQVDALTGIYNRPYFIRLAEIELVRSQRYGGALSAVMLDLDHFKAVNDTYGHAAGDQVLAEVVERCKAKMRASDLFGRYGGEEFMIIMPETDLDGAVKLAERIRQAVAEQPFETEGQQVGVTISAGAATLDEDTSTLAMLLARADAAMYSAKHNGRNRVAK